MVILVKQTKQSCHGDKYDHVRKHYFVPKVLTDKPTSANKFLLDFPSNWDTAQLWPKRRANFKD